MIAVLSYGGGVQSVAMVLLVLAGKLPRPDYCVSADTSREMPTTWEYLQTHIAPRFAAAGMTMHIADHRRAAVDLYGLNGDLLIPAYTATAKLPTYCSTEWKARPVARLVAELSGRPQAEQIHWIGFSLDERRRIKTRDQSRRYPLIDLMMTRTDCERLIAEAGLPLPNKSRCWMCPHQNAHEWREVLSDPTLREQAAQLDAEIRDNDARGGVYLHASRQPLADLDPATLTDAGRRGADRQCGLGLCFV
jgi:3'-phosphoadenosine 5'-phosphosulfate sulfotransferase (PAPS reductase)/FAD synthetase